MHYDTELVADYGELGRLYKAVVDGRDVFLASKDGSDLDELVAIATTPAPAPGEYETPQFPNLEPDQFWFALRVSGYEQDVLAWIASLNDQQSPTYDPVAWAAASAKLEFAKYFERDHPLILAAAQAIGISEQELDDLWVFAAA